MPTLTTIDPATEPFLSGRFAPVHDELDVDHRSTSAARFPPT